jgi:AcrR family transcriptional regulator
MDERDEARATHSGGRPGARERILDTSFDLFARRGIRDVGVDEIITRCGVAKATFYRHFPSKDDLVLAYLDRWFTERSAAIAAATERVGQGEEALLAVFGVLDDWFQRGAAEASAFLHVMIEMGPEHPLGRASIDYLTRTREQLAALAEAARLDDPEGFAWSSHILIKGAMVADAEGDKHAAERARLMASLLIEHHRKHRGVTQLVTGFRPAAASAS